VEVVIPAGVAASDVRVDADGRDVTSAFAVRADGRFYGLLTGLVDGPNIVTARLPDGSGARLTVTNHPVGGPVFAGDQVEPWLCNPGALDAQCNRAATYSFMYRSTNPSKSGFQRYDTDNPPSDVATTTTDQGK